MSLDSYSALKTEIGDWLDRDDLADYVDTFIDLGEARLAREVRIREMLSRDTLAISDGDRYVDLPADFLDIKYLRILIPDVTNGRRYYPSLAQYSIHELTERSTNATQRPCAFSIHEQIEFDSEADRDYDGELFYYTKLTALDDTNTSNAILVKAPDVYLWACLCATAPFLTHDERIPVWNGFYTDAVEKLNMAEIQNKHAGPLVSRVPGVKVPR